MRGARTLASLRQWLIYIVVPDVAKSVAKATNAAARLSPATPQVGKEGGYCVLKDPVERPLPSISPARDG